jgi:hypothetical protein
MLSLRDNWARQTSPNKLAKVYIGAPASSSAAGSGYVDIGTLKSIAVQMRQSFPSFGGVMLWDASQAFGILTSPSIIHSCLTHISDRTQPTIVTIRPSRMPLSPPEGRVSHTLLVPLLPLLLGRTTQQTQRYPLEGA